MLRILSDLHLRDASSRIRRLDDLAPLLEGIDELWLNGDTCDNQSGMPAAALEELQAYFISRVPAVRFLTGNHDPDISGNHEASCAEGQVWVTHGDVFMDDMVPWGRIRAKLVACLHEILASDPSLDFSTFEGRIQAMRQAAARVGRNFDPERTHVSHQLARLFAVFFPPRQTLAMLHTWWTFPTRVVACTRRWRPQARIIVTGHVHFPRIWHRGDTTVINTGAFTGPLGARAVDIDAGLLTVRPIQQRHGAWHPGRPLLTIPLASPGTPPLSKQA